jgi:hypothetical protein
MSEMIREEEQEEEYKGVIMYGWKLYAFILITLFVLSTVSFNAYTAHNEARKANTTIEQVNASKGAKIESLLNTISSNKEQWEKLEAEQTKLNESTRKSEEALEKMNISIIN